MQQTNKPHMRRLAPGEQIQRTKPQKRVVDQFATVFTSVFGDEPRVAPVHASSFRSDAERTLLTIATALHELTSHMRNYESTARGRTNSQSDASQRISEHLDAETHRQLIGLLQDLAKTLRRTATIPYGALFEFGEVHKSAQLSDEERVWVRQVERKLKELITVDLGNLYRKYSPSTETIPGLHLINLEWLDLKTTRSTPAPIPTSLSLMMDRKAEVEQLIEAMRAAIREVAVDMELLEHCYEDAAEQSYSSYMERQRNLVKYLGEEVSPLLQQIELRLNNDAGHNRRFPIGTITEGYDIDPARKSWIQLCEHRILDILQSEIAPLFKTYAPSMETMQGILAVRADWLVVGERPVLPNVSASIRTIAEFHNGRAPLGKLMASLDR